MFICLNVVKRGISCCCVHAATGSNVEDGFGVVYV